jgi:predicted DsbA family dithiol-disulfide isomerase
VREDERTAAGFGINGVPFFVLDRKIGVSGAQPAEVLLGALEQAAAG